MASATRSQDDDFVEADHPMETTEEIKAKLRETASGRTARLV